MRQDLGIAEEQTVVLYAPTFRDDVLAVVGPEAETRLALDAAALAGLDRGLVLLVRLHYMLRGRAVVPEHPAVQDVSGHPEIADLHLAADALVTDYSSSMFDFAVTGKPIVLYPYDLEHYRDDMRGLYVDLAEQAPGPLVRTARQLVDTLNDLPAVHREYAEAYRRFQRQYCPLDDGPATKRFLAHVVPAA